MLWISVTALCRLERLASATLRAELCSAKVEPCVEMAFCAETRALEVSRRASARDIWGGGGIPPKMHQQVRERGLSGGNRRGQYTCTSVVLSARSSKRS
jgi:hypothetical protein